MSLTDITLTDRYNEFQNSFVTNNIVFTHKRGKFYDDMMCTSLKIDIGYRIRGYCDIL